MFAHQTLYAAWLGLAFFVSFTAAALRTYNLTVHSDVRSPDGVSREVYLINGLQPGPLIEANEGDSLEIFVKNGLSVDTSLHWHGILQQGTPNMDGVVGVTQYPIPPGGNFTYKFSVHSQYGFFWYHTHVRAYYNDGIRGPLLIHPSPSRVRSFEKLANSTRERDALLRAEKNATNILLNDWTHEVSDTIYSQYFETGAYPFCVDSILANGLGRVECLPEDVLQSEGGSGMGMSQEAMSMSMTQNSVSPSSSMTMAMKRQMDMGSMETETATSSQTSTSTMAMDMTMSAMPIPSQPSTGMSNMGTMTMSGMSPSMTGMTSLSARGCSPPMMFREGYNASSLPPDTCTNTSSPLLTIPADFKRGWLALNLVNSGAVSKLHVSLDAHSMYVYAADGLYVEMQEVKVLEIEIGQRYSVMIRLNQKPGNYYLRFATYPDDDMMKQVLEGQAILSYTMPMMSGRPPMNVTADPSMEWMMINGSAKPDTSVLNPSLLSPFEPVSPPLGKADQTYAFTINQSDIVTWTMNGTPYMDAEIPIIQGNVSDGWNANTTIHLPFNSTIDVILRIANDTMDKMGHPMHLHGHNFWVLGSGTGSFPYDSVTEAPESLINLRNPPYRDTTNLPQGGWAAIRFVSDNPGAWIFHCHIQWHMLSGMAVVFVEGEDQIPELIGRSGKGSTATVSAGVCRNSL